MNFKVKIKIIWLFGILGMTLLNTVIWAYAHNWNLIWSIFNDCTLTIWLFNSSLNYILIVFFIIWTVLIDEIRNKNYDL